MKMIKLYATHINSLDLKTLTFICSRIAASLTLTFLNLFLKNLKTPLSVRPHASISTRLF